MVLDIPGNYPQNRSHCKLATLLLAQRFTHQLRYNDIKYVISPRGYYFQSCDRLRVRRSPLLMNEIVPILFHTGPYLL
jgi:hypothetical protein